MHSTAFDQMTRLQEPPAPPDRKPQNKAPLTALDKWPHRVVFDNPDDDSGTLAALRSIAPGKWVVYYRDEMYRRVPNRDLLYATVGELIQKGACTAVSHRMGNGLKEYIAVGLVPTPPSRRKK